jgi:hypothetical protein
MLILLTIEFKKFFVDESILLLILYLKIFEIYKYFVFNLIFNKRFKYKTI